MKKATKDAIQRNAGSEAGATDASRRHCKLLCVTMSLRLRILRCVSGVVSASICACVKTGSFKALSAKMCVQA